MTDLASVLSAVSAAPRSSPVAIHGSRGPSRTGAAVEVLLDKPHPKPPGDEQYSGIKNKYFNRLQVGSSQASSVKALPLQRRATVSSDSSPYHAAVAAAVAATTSSEEYQLHQGKQTSSRVGGASPSRAGKYGRVGHSSFNSPPIDIPSSARRALKIPPPQFTAASLPLGTPPLFTPPQWRAGLQLNQHEPDAVDERLTRLLKFREEHSLAETEQDSNSITDADRDQSPFGIDDVTCTVSSSSMAHGGTTARASRPGSGTSASGADAVTPRRGGQFDSTSDLSDLVDDMDLQDSDDSAYFESASRGAQDRLVGASVCELLLESILHLTVCLF